MSKQKADDRNEFMITYDKLKPSFKALIKTAADALAFAQEESKSQSKEETA